MRRATAALLAPVLATVAGWGAPVAALPFAGADASGPCGEHGVTVVVEPAALGGKPEIGCDAHGGGRVAARIFADTGHRLTRVSTSPDFVCKVDARPAGAGCGQVPPADAYWSLWWSDGTAPWTYASIGVDGLAVPDGGAVAFTWVDGSADGRPRTAVSSGSVASSPVASPSADGPRADHDGHADHADHAGLPGWIPPLAVVVVLGAAGAVVITRRSRR